MSRPYDWEPLASSDPIPGDPDQVAQLARQLRDLAQTISDQTRQLRNLANGSTWHADTEKTFAESATKVADDLDKVYGRYEAAYDAVNYYQSQLQSEQDVTASLLTQAKTLSAEHSAAQNRLSLDAQEPTADAAGNPVQMPYRHYADKDTVSNYSGNLGRLQSQMHDSQDRIAGAANSAASHIDQVAGSDGLKDSFWDKVGNAIDGFVSAVEDFSKVLSEISTWVSLAAALLCWVPVVGEILGAVALGLAALQFGLDAILALDGKVGWGKLGLDVLFVFGGAAAKGLAGGARAMLAGGKMSKAAEAATETVVSRSALLARGGQEAELVNSALRLGDTTTVAALSGLEKSEVGHILGGNLAAITRSTGTLRGGREVLLEMEKAGFKGSDFNAFKNLREDIHNATHLPETTKAIKALVADPKAALNSSGTTILENLKSARIEPPSAHAIVKMTSSRAFYGAMLAHDYFDAFKDEHVAPEQWMLDNTKLGVG